jgi:hypothetical protein
MKAKNNCSTFLPPHRHHPSPLRKMLEKAASREGLQAQPKTNLVSHQRREKCISQFKELCNGSIEDQLEFFLKSFIFALGDRWKEVSTLASQFHKYCRDGGEGRTDLNPVQASDFLVSLYSILYFIQVILFKLLFLQHLL